MAKRDSLTAESMVTSEQELLNLTKNSIQGVVVHRDNRPLYANQAFANMVGLAGPEEVLALKSVDDYVAPSEKERLASYRQRRSRGEWAPESYEFQALRSDGQLIWLETRVNVTEWEGAPAIQSMHFDVTDRHEASLALEASEKRFRHFAEAASDWLWETDDQHRFTYFSPDADNVDPNSIGQNLGTTRFDRRLPDDKDDEKWRAHNADLAARRPFKDFEFPIKLPDGTFRHIRVNGHPILSADGQFVGYRGAGSDITEYMLTERARHQSERRYRNLVEGSIQGIIVHRNDRVLLANQAMANILGYDNPEALYRLVSIDEYVHPDDRDRTRGYRAARLAGEEAPDNYEFRVLRKDGTICWVDCRVTIVAWDSEPAFQVAFFDVTQRKFAEEARRESEQRFRDLTTASSDWYWETDAEHRFTLLSEKSPFGTGRVASSAVGKNRLQTLDKKASKDPKWVAHLDDLEARRPFKDLQYDQVDVQGEMMHIKTSGVPYFDAKGIFLGYRGVATDVTAEVEARDAAARADAELRKSAERYRELFDNSPFAFWEEDWSQLKQMMDDLARDGVTDWRDYFNSHRDQLKAAYDSAKVIEISQAAIDLYRERSKEDIIRRSSAAAVIDEELDAFLEIILQIMEGQMQVDIEATDVAGDDLKIIVRRRVVIPPRYRGDWTRVFYAVEDVTDRKAIEDQLRQAQKMEAVGQLTGGVAHDFNNLLAVIMGNSELLQDELTVEIKPLQDIFRAADRGARLIERLLAFSRLQPLETQAVDTGALVYEMGDLLRRTLGETIEVKIASRPDLWHARVDLGQLENALLNLALNARDAMRQGGELSIESRNATLDETYTATHMEVSPGDYVLISVSDSGTGMSPEVLAHALEPFFTTKDVGKGSGLGLSMVYGFAKQSDGDLEISSDESLGTTIKLYLPRVEESEDRSDSDAEIEIPRGQGETVLVIEDESDVRALANALLRSLGYRVLTAEDGRAGLEILKTEAKIDLMLSDVVLPGGMSGPDFAIEARHYIVDLKVVFMSGYAEGLFRHQGLPLEDADLLRKPFRRHELAQKIRTVLDS